MAFQNVTNSAGIIYAGQTWSASWGDVDGDGDLDLWISKHNPHTQVRGAENVTLYVNNNSGKFTNVTSTDVQRLNRDYHGSKWADFDNDGDQDMAIAHSTEFGSPIGLFRNDSGHLNNIDTAAGLIVPNAYTLGRNLLWMDYDRDGLLDIFYGADRLTFLPIGTFPDTMVFRQDSPGTFVQTTADVGLKVSAGTPLTADLDGDGSQELILARYGAFGEILNTRDANWTNTRPTWLSGIPTPVFDDAVIADFDNDLDPDIYLTRSGVVDEVALRNPHQIRTYFTDAGQQKAFSFKTAGIPSVVFPAPDGAVNLSMVHVGATGRNPFTDAKDFSFSLSTTNDQGLAPLTTAGVYIGYDVANGEWDYVVVPRASSFPGFPSRGVIINSTAPITGLQARGVVLNPPDAPDQLLLNDGTRFRDASVSSGVAKISVYGRNCAAGDFDNDGDVDIYVDQATPALNRGNLLLLNRGDGTFVRTVAQGAVGTTLGTGGAVAVADYDQDGFLDIVTLAGGANPPYNALQDGPAQLFRNIPNSNHWLEVRLKGAQLDGDPLGANADAIGAKVYVTAGGKTQYREAVGGQHIEAQDSPLLHFGLGGNTAISELRVVWPNGASTTVLTTGDVPIDGIIEIRQPVSAGGVPGQVGLLSPVEDPSHDGDGTGLVLTDDAAPGLFGADPLLQLGLLQFEGGATAPADLQAPTLDLSALEEDAFAQTDTVAVEAVEAVDAGGASGDWLVA